MGLPYLAHRTYVVNNSIDNTVGARASWRLTLLLSAMALTFLAGTQFICKYTTCSTLKRKYNSSQLPSAVCAKPNKLTM